VLQTFKNVAAVLDCSGNLVGTFPKQRPVPLMVDGRRGDRCPVFPFPMGTLGIGLCYDFDAPAVAGALTASGATILVAPTGDLMPWGAVQHVNHELLVRLRAVENDRWILRATTSGRSEAIDPHGRPSVERLDIGETGLVAVTFASRSTFALGCRMFFLGPWRRAPRCCSCCAPLCEQLLGGAFTVQPFDHLQTPQIPAREGAHLSCRAGPLEPSSVRLGTWGASAWPGRKP
jgi:Carbon-nitrogen hydrolase